jgi:hypothetical protein
MSWDDTDNRKCWWKYIADSSSEAILRIREEVVEVCKVAGVLVRNVSDEVVS